MPNMGSVHGEVVGSHTGYGEYLRRCRINGTPVNMVKVVRDGGMLMEALSVWPQTITIWRGMVTYPGEDTDQDNPDGDFEWPLEEAAARAAEWMALLHALWLPDKAVTRYLEITNEANIANPHQAEAQNLFYIECMKWADAHPQPFKIAIGSFSAGCPEPWAIEILAPAFDHAARHGHIVALHDGALFSGQTLRQAVEEGTACRYRMFNEVLARARVQIPKYVITEGYREGGYLGMNEEGWADLMGYLQELSSDGILGWAWFTLGDYSFDGARARLQKDRTQAQTRIQSALAEVKGAAGSVNIVGQLANGKYPDHLCATAWPDPPESPPPPPQRETVLLKVKYLSQLGPDASMTANDCGPACEAMIDWYHGHEERGVDDWFLATGAGQGAITVQQLVAAAAHFGYTADYRVGQTLDYLRARLDAGKPVILLVNAGRLSGAATDVAHFVLAVGYQAGTDVFYIHDPYDVPRVGGGGFIEQTDLAAAWYACLEQGNPNGACLVLEPAAPPPPPAPATRPVNGVGMGNPQAVTPVEREAVAASKAGAFMFLSTGDPDTDQANFDAVRSLPGVGLWIGRMFFNPDWQSQRRFTPEEFWATVRLSVMRLYALGVHLWQLHNEPNLWTEGLYQWTNGAKYAAWHNRARELAQAEMPYAQIGFPGLSPQEHDDAGVCRASLPFLREAAAAVSASPWVGVHCYWQDDGTGHWQMRSSDFGGMYWQRVRAECPGKPLIITEYNCNNPAVPDADKGAQYRIYPSLIDGSAVRAAASFALSWPGQDDQRVGWVRDGAMTDIPVVMGN